MAITEMIVPGLRRASAGSTASWDVWGTTGSVTVTDPAALPAARRLVGRQFLAAERVAARFRPDAELHRLYRAGGQAITVSPLLADLISAALLAAERTDGDVDPTVGAAMTRCTRPGPVTRATGAAGTAGIDPPSRPCGSRRTTNRPVRAGNWWELHGRRLRVPAGTTLDLSATAKAVACDRAAVQVREAPRRRRPGRARRRRGQCGPAPEAGWSVRIEDGPAAGRPR
jgi:thiamine biosynthesis lipoprotein